MLIAMAGLPGSGKSTLACELGRYLSAPVLSVDPVEAALWRVGIDRSEPTGLAAYVAVEAMAADILALSQTVIVDAVNDAEEARVLERAQQTFSRDAGLLGRLAADERTSQQGADVRAVARKIAAEDAELLRRLTE